GPRIELPKPAGDRQFVQWAEAGHDSLRPQLRPVMQQPSEHESASRSPPSTATGVAQQASPCHASTPSRMANTAMTIAATESAQAQPSSAWSSRPVRSAADRYVQISVCFESATADAEPSSRPVLRSNQLRT